MAFSSVLNAVTPPIRRIQPEETLNPEWFRQSISVLGIKLPAARTTEFMKHPQLKESLLELPKVKVVAHIPGNNQARILLTKFMNRDSLPGSVGQVAEEQSLELVQHDIDFDYDYWTAEEILRSVLPVNLLDDMPTSFTLMGHLAHLNLRDEYLPYKYVIGRVILDKNKGLRTVVNKVDAIDTQFRFFKMEVIAGEDDTIVEVHESNCRFKFDFAKVYWNSRLGTEHERLVSTFGHGELIADVFAGVGPFAVPAARSNCLVLANDLNPSSVEYLAENCRVNRVADRVRVTCLDGRDFIRHAIIEALQRPFENVQPMLSSRARSKQKRNNQPQSDPLPVQRRISHFVMNLPATAIEFLDAFKPAFRDNTHSTEILQLYGNKMPMIHVHCFTRELEQPQAEQDLLRRAEMALGTAIANSSFHCVRRVAPNKDMYCLSFMLPSAILD
ncbi:Met-10 protein MET-10 [Serendipita vermifera]|nr:Met-10 protein MET-10 [Serendipita vermifera]